MMMGWENKLLLKCWNFLGHLETPYWMSRPPKLSTRLHLSWWDRVDTFSFMSICILGEIKWYLEPRHNRMFLSLTPLKEHTWRKAGCWRGGPPLLFRRHVMWLEPCDLHKRKPRCIQEIIRATQAGFRRMQIFSECLKQTHTHTRTHTNYQPPDKTLPKCICIKH